MIGGLLGHMRLRRRYNVDQLAFHRHIQDIRLEAHNPILSV